MKKYCIFLFVLFGFLLGSAGCKRTDAPFTFRYTIESVDNYKVAVTFGSDSVYRIEEYNYYMDNVENTRRPVVREGKLTTDEYAALTELLGENDFFDMKDTYGFEKEAAAGPILYQIYWASTGGEKYISIQDNPENRFSPAFLRLLQFIPTFLASHPGRGK